MATCRLILKPKPYADGTYPIQIVIRYKREYTKTISSVKKRYWNAKTKRVKSNHPNWTEINKIIGQQLYDAEMYLDHCKFNNIEIRPDLFFWGEASDLLVNLINHKINECRRNKKFATAQRIEAVVNKIIAFGAEDIKLNEIDHDWVVSFDRYLIKKYNNKANTRERTHREIKPYCRDAYSNFKSRREKSIKDYLELIEIDRLERIKLEDTKELARDLWLFSFYSRGVRVHDCMILKDSNVSSGRLRYYSQKSGFKKYYDVKISDKCRLLIDKWSGVSEYGYLFPVCQLRTSTLESFVKHIGRRNSFIRKKLHAIFKDLKINKNISMHSARYTYAILKYKQGASIAAIQMALGHESPQTTVLYLGLVMKHQELDDALGE